MPMKLGTYLGGVRDVESLRAKCVVDDETGCWHWSLSSCEGRPSVWIVLSDGVRRKFHGRRAALLLARGKDLPSGHVAYQAPCCPSGDCVRPEHALCGTRKGASQAASERGAFSSPARAQLLLRHTSARQKVSPEQQLEIASSDAPAAQLAEQYGVCIGRVRAIRRGEFGQRARVATSVFNWRPA